ncbi:hypothetical protein Y1Q_0002363 [Alligator mississippiensis]|uniref:Uncharacterized protein n=2 Tax=Alligator mississippiensis TaxID=8496 RepID=A0A151MH86_ALLMI|nr:hypothetical protein Y1Q_0002363 [Alligator mississippiensis]
MVPSPAHFHGSSAYCTPTLAHGMAQTLASQSTEEKQKTELKIKVPCCGLALLASRRCCCSSPPRAAAREPRGRGKYYIMGLKTIWKNYKVLIVMGPSLVLIHWGWYNIQSNPIFKMKREDLDQEPGIVTHVMQQDSKNQGK